jgi:hypothetical protein
LHQHLLMSDDIPYKAVVYAIYSYYVTTTCEDMSILCHCFHNNYIYTKYVQEI